MAASVPGQSLRFEPDLCGGCLCCQTTCVESREGIGGLAGARLRVALQPFTGDHTMAYCRQCRPAPCAEVCPVGAITLRSGGYWEVDYEVCSGCQSCVSACPFGAMLYDLVGNRVIKCDTCRGNPACVGACPSGALTLVGAREEVEA